MDEIFWRYIFIIPIGTGVIVGLSILSIFYEFVKSTLVKLAPQTSIIVKQSRINETKKQVVEVEKYKNDHNLLVKVILREILWAFRNVFIACIGIVIYYLIQSVTLVLSARYSIKYIHLLELTLVTLRSTAIIFFWYHFNTSLRQILVYYRLVKNIINYSNYIKEKTTEINQLKKT